MNYLTVSSKEIILNSVLGTIINIKYRLVTACMTNTVNPTSV